MSTKHITDLKNLFVWVKTGCCTHPAGCPDAGSLEGGRGAHVEGVVALQHSVHVEVGHGVVTQPAPLLLYQRGQQDRQQPSSEYTGTNDSI